MTPFNTSEHVRHVKTSARVSRTSFTRPGGILFNNYSPNWRCNEAPRQLVRRNTYSLWVLLVLQWLKCPITDWSYPVVAALLPVSKTSFCLYCAFSKKKKTTTKTTTSHWENPIRPRTLGKGSTGAIFSDVMSHLQFLRLLPPEKTDESTGKPSKSYEPLLRDANPEFLGEFIIISLHLLSGRLQGIYMVACPHCLSDSLVGKQRARRTGASYLIRSNFSRALLFKPSRGEPGAG